MEASDTQSIPPGFHVQGGLSFCKQEDGVVEIRIAESANGQGSVRYVRLAPTDWASVVATVSDQGENGASFKAALTFHHAQAALSWGGDE